MASVAEVQIAEQNAADALTNVRGTLVLALQKIDSYIEKLSTAGSLARKAEMLNWTLNQLAISITPNLRLDLIDNAQAMVKRLTK
ncbi:MAG: hypothetical protein IV084_01275 [Rugosibacter sp.]|nr:hypothetical protein [Rugosibacter sp.]